MIVHPAFKNISFKEAERLLADMDQGECIVRPSSKVSDPTVICLRASSPFTWRWETLGW